MVTPATITTSHFEHDVLHAPGPVLIDLWAPWCGIRMKLSIDNHRQRSRLAVLAQTLAQYLRRCASCSRRLDHHPFGGGTGVGETVVQCDLRPQDGLPPPVGEGLDMPDEFPHAACTSFPHPERRTQRRTKGSMQHNEAPAAIQIPSCRVFLPRFDRRAMPRTLPRWQDQCSLPSSRIDLDARCSLP